MENKSHIFCVEICRVSTQMQCFELENDRNLFLDIHKMYGIVSDLTQNVFGFTENVRDCF